jgi:hypothetical protein
MKPVEKTFPERELNFPLNIIVNFMPKEGQHQLKPDDHDLVKHGEYVITAAACYDCHTPMEKGRFMEGMDYAGGFEFPLQTGGIVRASNITPHKETGIGRWTKEDFLNRFWAHSDSSYVPKKLENGEFSTYMPWDHYSKMEDRDLEAIYAYLMTLKPIENEVVKFSAN